MQLPENAREPACYSNRHVAAACRRYGPLALLLVPFAAFDFLVPLTARTMAGLSREGLASSTFATVSMNDESGTRFSVELPTPASEFYLPAVLIGMLAIHAVQQAVLAIWAVFGLGRWPMRLGFTMAASAGCYALIETQLLEDAENWVEAARGLATIPLNVLAIAAPLAACRIWSGRRLSSKADLGACTTGVPCFDRRFAIRDALLITAWVGAALGLVRWTAFRDETPHGRMQEIAIFTGFMLLWSAIYYLPLAWGLLAPPDARRRLIFGWIYFAIWVVVPGASILAGDPSRIDQGMNIGLSLGFGFTAPISLLIQPPA